jgi:hypothetical protein
MYVHLLYRSLHSLGLLWCDVARVTIDKLPDVALLRIFDFYMDEEHIEAWRTLVHVCREWRTVVFGSPRRLNLRLRCTDRTPVRETLGVWPLLPIAIRGHGRAYNIIAAVEHNDRICQLGLFGRKWEKVSTAIQRPFPALTCLELRLEDETAPAVPVDPASFLGGSAPCLQKLSFNCIPFPGLPTLLLSATHLVDLNLRRIPDSGYISPVAMVTSLSVLTRLESFEMGFKSPRYLPDWKSRRPPQTRTLLPVLTLLRFFGASEYLEDFVARIDAPLLDKLHITFFHQLTFNTAQLTQFISRTPKFKTHDEAHVGFSDWRVSVTIPQIFGGRLYLGISRGQLYWEPLPMTQVCSSSFPQALVSTVEHLYILEYGLSQLSWQDDQWLEFLRPFTGVKGLYISQEFVPGIAPTLQELAREGVTEVLPALQTLSLEEPLPSEPVLEIIGQFVAARRLAGHTIAIFLWER